MWWFLFIVFGFFVFLLLKPWRPTPPTIETLDTQQGQLYIKYCQYMDTLIGKTIQPDKQKVKLKEIQKSYKETKKVRELFMRAFVRNDRDTDLRISIIQGWLFYLTLEAKQQGYYGTEKLPTGDDQNKLWNIQKEEVVYRLKKLVS